MSRRTERAEWSGGRDPSDPHIRAELIYKARPLNGIWAVAPYLHNGSVPTLDALLSPEDSARPSEFWMGSKQYDPVKVGYDGSEIPGATLFDTTMPGNSNQGHLYGTNLSSEDKLDLLEYLKGF